MNRKRVPDGDLFREAVRDVKPLSHTERVVQPRKRPRRARARPADRAALLLENTLTSAIDLSEDEPLTYRKAGVRDSVLRKLRRGQIPVEAQVDLHGLTVAQATGALQSFLVDAVTAKLRCVRVVHGKGLRSGERGPLLRRLAHAILRQSGVVLAFVPAADEDGGTGAVNVLLAVT